MEVLQLNGGDPGVNKPLRCEPAFDCVKSVGCGLVEHCWLFVLEHALPSFQMWLLGDTLEPLWYCCCT